MLLYDKNNNKISPLDVRCGSSAIHDTYVVLSWNHSSVLKQGAVLYEPDVKGEKSRIGIIMVHSDSDYSTFHMCSAMAARGYVTLGSYVRRESLTLDEKLLDLHTAVSFLRNYSGIEKIVLLGHSGGASLVSAYKAIAENGASVFQGGDMLLECKLEQSLADADGVMLLDSNWGNGAMTLFSIDPAVTDDDSGCTLDPEFDIYNPENGFSPDGAEYPEAFIRKYLEAQRDRNNRLIRKALERLHIVESGKGRFNDDEPFIVAGGALSLPCNKLFPQDLHLFSHTKGRYTLLRKDGSESCERIFSVRRSVNFGNVTQSSRQGALLTTVRQFLSERGVTAGKNYNIAADGASGIEWEHCYNCTPSNVRYIHSPILCMGMTGSYEYLAAEEIYQNAVSSDKEIAFVEGADHMFRPIDEKYGDTEKTLCDYADRWLFSPGRFI